MLWIYGRQNLFRTNVCGKSSPTTDKFEILKSSLTNLAFYTLCPFVCKLHIVPLPSLADSMLSSFGRRPELSLGCFIFDLPLFGRSICFLTESSWNDYINVMFSIRCNLSALCEIVEGNCTLNVGNSAISTFFFNWLSFCNKYTNMKE